MKNALQMLMKTKLVLLLDKVGFGTENITRDKKDIS